MALVLDDRVKETSTTTGTGTLDLSGAVSGFQTFVAGIGNSNTTYYAIVNRDEAEWEVGLGTVTDASTDTLARTTVISSSNSDSATNFSAGTKDVFCTLPASKVANLDTNDNLTIGAGSAGVDYTLTFDGADSDGVLTWMEDEDLFKFTDVINVGVDDAGHDVKFFGNTASRYWLWDTSADGVVQLGTLTVGVDDAGYDVKFFGNTASAYMLWDTSADDLVLAGAAGIDLAGDIDVDGTANLDIVDIDGAVQLDATLTVGADDQGYDIKFFGDTASAYMLWDTSADDLVLAGAAGIDLAGDIDVDGTANLDIVDIDGAVQIDATFTSGVDGQGYDTKFFGDTSSAYILWDTSEDKLLTAGGALIDIVKDKLMIGGTAVTTTAAELNLLDTASANSVVNSKAVIYGSSGELAGTLSTAAQTNVTSLGTLTALTVDDVAVNGKVVTMTGSASDTAVFTAGTHGTLSIVTTDAAAAAANIQITADGTAELAGTTVTLDSAADIELEATDDINVPSGVGMTFGNDGEKIEGDGSDLTISGNTVNLDSTMNHTFASTGKAMVLGF
jgi:hypothetical protein